ncbi:MAG TPA: YfaZ family outer membrane protein [Pseudohongiella sp.]|nr:YfaZ family outer membrane protein [Pseudohongiella sp.]
MSFKIKHLAPLATLLAVGAVNAHTLDLAINDDAVGFDFTTQIPKSELNLGAGLLHHQDLGDAFYGSLFVADNVNKQSGILAGIGARYYFIDADEIDQDGTALGIGGFMNWDVPGVPNLSLRGDLYYAPDVLSFGEVEKFVDFSGRVQYRLIEQAWVYLGYRRAKVSPEEGNNQNIDEGAMIGVMVWF